MLLKANFHATLHAKGRQNGFDGAKTSMRYAVSREGELLNSPQLLSPRGLFEKVHEAHILYLQVLTISMVRSMFSNSLNVFNLFDI